MTVVTPPLPATRRRREDLGRAPVVGALVLLALGFQALNPTFLSPNNLVNLTLQATVTGVITLGLVLVLLVGHIDLSVGAVSGLAGAIVAVGYVGQGWPLAVAVLVAIGVGVTVGLTYGWVVTRIGVPSFVVSLAGLLVCGGLQVWVLGSTGSVNLPFDSWLVRLAQSTFLPAAVSWALVAAVVLVVAGAGVLDRRRRVAAGLPAPELRSLAGRVVALGALTAIPVWYLNLDRGVGVMVALFLAGVVAVDLGLRHTRWGRAARAVGSSPESARLAGLSVSRVYYSAFAACAGLAAVGGVLAVGRLAAANQGMGGTDLALTAIAAAVIGGTSLFGGRGSAGSAALGALVVHTIASGLTLLNLDAAWRLIVTGLVLALAVVLDTVGRRGSTGPRPVRSVRL